MTDKHEALIFADDRRTSSGDDLYEWAIDAEDWIRRLHAENETMRAGHEAARLEIESLQARIKTMAEERADELIVAHLDGRMRAAQQEAQEQVALSYRHVVEAWNAQADEHNQWDNLGEDEKIEWAVKFAQAAPAAVAGPSEAVAYLDIGAGGYLDLGTDLTDEALSRLPKGRHALVIAGTYGIDGYIAAPTAQPAPQQEATRVDPKTMELAESVGLIGPASRTHDLHAAIQRFHDLICANATIKAAAMAAEVISGAPADSALEDAARYRFLAAHCRSTSEHWGGRWSIVVEGPAPKSHDSEDDFDEAVDAARNKGANHD